MIVVLTPEAEADLVEAKAWLRDRSVELPARFEAAVAKAIGTTREHPLASPLVHPRIRRVLTHRFPYGIFYLVEKDRLVIFAVVHQARHPSVWRRRV